MATPTDDSNKTNNINQYMLQVRMMQGELVDVPTPHLLGIIGPTDQAKLQTGTYPTS